MKLFPVILLLGILALQRNARAQCPSYTFGAMPTVCAGSTTANFPFTGSGGHAYKVVWDAYATSSGFVSTPSIITTVVGNHSIGGSFSGDGGAATAAGLNWVDDLALDGSGNMYVVDAHNNRVRKVSASGIISTFAGNGTTTYGGTGVAATAVGFAPSGITVDGAGNVYIVDAFNIVVRKVSTSGIITTIAGQAGHTGNSGDGGPATAALFAGPTDVAVDATGNVYVSDGGNNNVRKINTSGIISTIAGSTALSGTYAGDGGPATAAGFYGANGLAIDASGNLYISDFFNHVVRKVNTSGIISTVAGNNAIGSTYSGDGGAATAAALSLPADVEVDAYSNLYIADNGNGVFRKVSASGIISTVAGNGGGHFGYSGDGGAATAATLYAPQNLVVDAIGDLYLADGGSNVVRKVSGYVPLSSSPIIVSVPALAPVGTYSGVISMSNGSCADVHAVTVTVAPSAQTITGATTVCAGSTTLHLGYHSGGSWSSSAPSIASVGTTGLVTGVATGTATLTYQIANACGVTTTTALITVVAPAALTLGTLPSICSGDTLASITYTGVTGSPLYKINWSDAAIAEGFVSTPAIITTAAGSVTMGGTYTGDGGPATAAGLNWAEDVAKDAFGNMYICDVWNYVVRKVNSAGIISTLAGTGTAGFSGDGGYANAAALGFPNAVAVDALGNVYIADNANSVVRKVNTSGIISTVAGIPGTYGYSGDGGAATAAMFSPIDIAIDATGNLYIVDQVANVVRKVNTSGIISTIAGNGSSGYSGDGGAATAATLNSPNGVTVDGSGNVYIAELLNNVIRKVNTSGVISTFVGTGSSGFSGDGGPASAARLSFPAGVEADAYGNVYIADLGNNVYRKVDVSGNISTIAGVHSGSGSTADSTPALGYSMYTPQALCIDAIGDLYLADGGSSKILKFSSFITLPSSPVTVDVPGTAPNGVYNGTMTVTNGICSNTYPISVTIGASDAGAISGLSTVCTGATITLTNSVTGGAWSSSNIGVASVGSTGIVTGVSSGTAIISYSISSSCGSAFSTKTISVSSSVFSGTISGASTICSGSYTTLTGSESGGTWSSSNTGVATVGSTGVVMGISTGSAVISYSVSGSCGTGYAIKTMTVTSAGIAAGTITTLAGTGTAGNTGDGGPATAAQMTTKGIGIDGAGNIYISDNGRQVRKIALSGIISTVAGNGTGGVSGDGGPATAANLSVSDIDVDYAGNIYIADGGDNVVRKVNTSGIISTLGSIFDPFAVAADHMGNVYVSSDGKMIYKIDTSGAIIHVSGNGLASFSGDGGPSTAARHGNVYNMVCDDSGNLYISDNPNFRVRKINARTGIITSVAEVGNAIGVDIDPAGNIFVASSGNTIYRADTFGTVTLIAGTGIQGFSGDGGPATAALISRGTGLRLDANGDIIFADNLNYRVRKVTKSLFISAPPAICRGTTTVITGSESGGAWSSSNPSIASVGSAGTVTGVSTGTATISYYWNSSCGTVLATKSITVDSPLVADSISGAMTVCRGATTTFTNSVSGGVWTSSRPATASVTTGGVVSGGTVGTATITYTISNACGTIISTKSITVLPATTAGTITGTSGVCIGSTTTFSNTTSGGVWSSSNTGVATVGSTGIVSGLSAGTARITYSVTGVCGTALATKTTTVSIAPTVGTISGASSICTGATTTLTNSTTGGTWSSSNTGVATIGSTGVVTGVANGTATISYLVSVSCGSAVATKTISVGSSVSLGTIAGASSVCTGATTTLTNSTSGGAWSSSNTGVATIGSTGVVTGVSSGTVTISYSVSGSCGSAVVTHTITVGSSVSAGTITGVSSVCTGSTATLANSTSGGAWSSSNTGVATVGSTGVVTGVSSGTAVISYSVSGSCGSAVATKTLSVSTSVSPGSIIGASSVCIAATITLSNSTSGGAWSSGNIGVATVGSTGVVSGVSSGTATISYTVPGTCGSGVATKIISVGTSISPGTILGASGVYQGTTTILSNVTFGGSWSSSNTGVATIGSTGIVTGISIGTATISYTVGGSGICSSAVATKTIAVISTGTVGSLSGDTMVCVHSFASFSESISGGRWSSSNTAVATVDSTGLIEGISVGSATITYSVTGTGGSAYTTRAIYVNSGLIIHLTIGMSSICIGDTTTYTNSTIGGPWWSSNPAVATIDSVTGLVTGIANGTAIISYYMNNGCAASTQTKTITVGSVVTAGSISGTTRVCIGSTIPFTNREPRGIWSSSNTGVATVGSTGSVTGVSDGTATITYTITLSCGSAFTTTTLSVGTSGLAGTISGASSLCTGSTITLTRSRSGGSWSSSNTGVATVGSTGIVTGVANGTATITYSVSGSCGSAIATKTLSVGVPSISLGVIPVICSGDTTAPLSYTSVSGTEYSMVWDDTALANGFVNEYDIDTIAGNGGLGFSGDGGPATSATLGITLGMTFDVLNNLYLSETYTGTIRKITPSGIITTVGGNGTSAYTPDGYPNTSSLSNINNTSIDNSGNLYFVDATFIRKANISGTLSTIAGTGSGVYSGDGGPATAAGMRPTDCVRDSLGNIYVCGNNVIRKIDASGIITTVVGNNAIGGTYSGDGGPATAAGLNNPKSVIFDHLGNMYFSDASNFVVRKVNTAGIITTIAGNYASGSTYSGDGGPATAASLKTNGPSRLDFAPNSDLYIANNLLIRKVSMTTGIITSLPFAYNQVQAIKFNDAGDLYLSEYQYIKKLSNKRFTIPSSPITIKMSGTAPNGTYCGNFTVFNGACSNTYRVCVTVGSGGSAGTIAGSSSVCSGTTTTLTNSTSGGTWSSSNTGVAAIGSTGVVIGVTGGTATISYVVSGSCGSAVATHTITVGSSVSAGTISGASSVCTGATTALTNSTTGGSWSSSNTGVATIGSTGVVTGVSAGTTVISYTVTGSCSAAVATHTISVGMPGAISGVTSLCVGSVSTLSITGGGGSWVSSNTAIATIGSGTGVVTGVSIGSVTISYITTSGCLATTSVLVGSLASISGPSSVCVGQPATLTSSVGGGIWTSNNETIAVVGSSTGIVNGLVGGAAIISYTTGTGCSATTVVTVNYLAPITGASSICVGQSASLSNGVSGGTWSSNNTAIASIGSASGLVNGVSGGTVSITYLNPAGCVAFAPFTVNNSAPIGGASSVCTGQSTTLTNIVSGGVWSSSNPTIVSVGSGSGIASGIATGAATISYTTSGACVTTRGITVNSGVSISGGTNVCAGLTLNLSSSLSGGIWSSSDLSVASVGSVTGQVTGLTGGTTTISYVLPTGCMSTVVVNSIVMGAISGTSRVCTGQNVALSNSTPGGLWTSGNVLRATVGSTSGIVTGVTAGTVLMSYTLGSGCRATYNVTVSTISAISGSGSICGSQTTTLTNATAGGVWSSSNTGVATVGSTGIVTGLPAGGVATITYLLSTGCVANKVMTVTPFDVITGPSGVCVGQTITLANAQSGGAWVSSAPAKGTISSAGVVTGRSVGVTTISYTIGTCRATKTVNVSSLGSIAGALTVCVGQNTNLTNTGVGGIWISGNTAIGTVSPSTGAVTGVSAGTFIITYNIGTSCVATAIVTVNPLDATTGPTAVCTGQQVTLTNSTAGGGRWSSGNSLIATIGSSTGIVSGVTGGTTSISFTTPLGCRTTRSITVNTISAIAGTTAACQGLTSTLTNPGLGTWSSSDASIAAVGSSTAVVTGVASGTAIITFTLNTSGCMATRTFTVHPYSNIISGSNIVCISTPVTLTNTVSGGSWSVTNPTIASINATTGVVTAVGNATTNVTYTTPRGCRTVRAITSSTGCRSIGDDSYDIVPDVYSLFTLIPNPNKGEFTLKGTFVSGKDEDATIEVVNMFGQVVYSAKATAVSGVLSEKVQIDGNLANGMYLLNLHTDDEIKVFHFVLSR